MFERYTETARRAIFFARFEASEMGSLYIEPEHLLLGILRAGRAELTALAIPENFAGELQSAMPPAKAKISTSVDLPLSASAKRILSNGAEEADRMNHPTITPEHLLLGLLREKETLAAQLLTRHGITLELVEQRPAAVAANKKIVETLRQTFAPMAGRLAPEVEPAITFSLKSDLNVGAGK